MLIAAIEGPCFSGKSTLAKNLELYFSDNEMVFCPDYMEYVGGPQEVPPTPGHTVDDEINGLRYFISIDKQRRQKCLELQNTPKIVLLDRSIHTLLAHRFAIESVFGLKVFRKSCRIVSIGNILKPKLILYMDISQEVLEERSRFRKGFCHQIFKDKRYNSAFRSYFLPNLRWSNTPLKVFDSVKSKDAITESALILLQQSLNV